MYVIELTYRAPMGNLICTFTTSQTVGTITEAHDLREILNTELKHRGINGRVLLKHGKPLATPDEAMQAFRKHIAEYPPVRQEA